MSDLRISPEKAIDLINERIDEIQMVIGKQDNLGYYDFLGWCSKTYAAIDEIFGADGIHPEEIRSIGLPTCSCNAQDVAPMLLEAYHSRLLAYIGEIEGTTRER
jgi:hypothetical protein